MKTLSNQKGQFVIETVLLMIVTVGFFIWGTNQLRESKFLGKMIQEPWRKVAGMIESGVWQEADAARAKHPNTIDRSLTIKPE